MQNQQIKNFIASTVIVSLILGGIAGGIVGVLVNTVFLNRDFFATKAPNSNQSNTTVITENDLEIQSKTVSAVEEALPAVVSIIATQELQLLPRSSFFDNFFFGFPIEPQEPQEPQTQRREVSSGSGFIVTEDGLVITNRHVVSNTKADYSVVMSNGETFAAEVVDRDSIQDLAVVKIKPSAGEQQKFPVLSLGESKDVVIGQTVIAIGNTLGEFRNTVTRGIVSGINRTLTAGGGRASELIEGAIQTDAAISSGNSGGPLLNLDGQVIGVNTAVSQAGENVGFALPVDQVSLILESIKKYGKIVRPFLGVRYILLNKDIAERNNMEMDSGALIVRGEKREDLAVIPGSPADVAGLRENDIILKVDGREVGEGASLQSLLSRYKIGDQVVLKIYRAGQEMDIVVTLEDRGGFAN